MHWRKYLKPRPTPRGLIQTISNVFGCEREIFRQQGKKELPSESIRSALRKYSRETGIASGKHFGDNLGAGIVFKYNQVANQNETDCKLKDRVD